MKKILGLAAGLGLAVFAVPGLAQAQNAYTTTYVNLRAGPGFGYPVVLAVPPNSGLLSYGCLGDWSWCDVSVGNYRGWMSGEYIAYVYDNRWVPLYEYGPRYNVPIVTFVFGTYWDRYYRDRPWYRDRWRWERYDRDHHDDHHPPPHRDPPRTLPRADTHHDGPGRGTSPPSGNDGRDRNRDRDRDHDDNRNR